MRRLFFIGFFSCLLPLRSLAQDCDSRYQSYLTKGDAFLAEENFWSAIQQYNVVMIICPEQTAVAQARIKAVVDAMNQLVTKADNATQQALAQQQNAEDAKNEALAAKESILRMIEALAGKQDNYHLYFKAIADSAYAEGDYEIALRNFELANQAFDKAPQQDLSPKIDTVKLCLESQNQALQLIKEQAYEAAEEQIAQTLALNPQGYQSLLIANALNPNQYGLTAIKGRSFEMGSEEEDYDEQPPHTVVLDDYALGTYEVSNLAYAIFLNRYGSDTWHTGGDYEGEKLIYEDAWGLAYNAETEAWEVQTKGYEFHPVVNVTWYGATAFCEYYVGNLPSEAQWEYAARGGEASRGYRYAGSDTLDLVAWYTENSLSQIHAVGRKLPNELGLYDMTGNVWEWCQDWYEDDFYEQPEAGEWNPINNRVENSPYRVLRGGSWYGISDNCRPSNRDWNNPINWFISYGFRFSRTLEAP